MHKKWEVHEGRHMTSHRRMGSTMSKMSYNGILMKGTKLIYGTEKREFFQIKKRLETKERGRQTYRQTPWACFFHLKLWSKRSTIQMDIDTDTDRQTETERTCRFLQTSVSSLEGSLASTQSSETLNPRARTRIKKGVALPVDCDIWRVGLRRSSHTPLQTERPKLSHQTHAATPCLHLHTNHLNQFNLADDFFFFLFFCVPP